VYSTLIYMSLLGSVCLLTDKPLAAGLCAIIGVGDLVLRRRRLRRATGTLPATMRERREERRLPATGLRAHVHGAVNTVTAVIDVSKSGALLAPWARLPRGASLVVELRRGRFVVARRRALVVREAQSRVGVRFSDPMPDARAA